MEMISGFMSRFSTAVAEQPAVVLQRHDSSSKSTNNETATISDREVSHIVFCSAGVAVHTLLTALYMLVNVNRLLF
jgi:hypothetical protein